MIIYTYHQLGIKSIMILSHRLYSTSYPVSLIPPDKNEGPIPCQLSSRTYFLQNNSLDLLMIMKNNIVSKLSDHFQMSNKKACSRVCFDKAAVRFSASEKGDKKKSSLFSFHHSSRRWQPTIRVKQILVVFDLDPRELFYSFPGSFKRKKEESKINCLFLVQRVRRKCIHNQ